MLYRGGPSQRVRNGHISRSQKRDPPTSLLCKQRNRASLAFLFPFGGMLPQKQSVWNYRIRPFLSKHLQQKSLSRPFQASAATGEAESSGRNLANPNQARPSEGWFTHPHAQRETLQAAGTHSQRQNFESAGAGLGGRLPSVE